MAHLDSTLSNFTHQCERFRHQPVVVKTVTSEPLAQGLTGLNQLTVSQMLEPVTLGGHEFYEFSKIRAS